MGRGLDLPPGPLTLTVDLGGPALATGATVRLQLLGDDGGRAPAVLRHADVRVGDVVELDVDPSGSRWLLLRVVDRTRPTSPYVRAAGGPLAAHAIACASPWYLTPAGPGPG
jgi:hypothetical protein